MHQKNNFPCNFPKSISWKKQNGIKIGTYNINGLNDTIKRRVLARTFNEESFDVLGIGETHICGNGVRTLISQPDLTINDTTTIWDELNGWVAWSGVCEYYSRKAKDGVAIILSPRIANGIIEHRCVDSRIVWVKCRSGRHVFAFVSVYAPVNSSGIQGKFEMEAFWRKLDLCISSFDRDVKIIILGDMNAKVGNVPKDGLVGKYGVQGVDKNGEYLVEFCSKNGLFLANTFFRRNINMDFTWERNCGSKGEQKSLIDYIIVDKRLKRKLIDARVVRRLFAVSDHFPVVAILNVKTKWKKIVSVSPTKHNEKETDSKAMGEQSCGRIALILANFLIFGGTVAVNFLSAWREVAKEIFVPVSDEHQYGLGVPPEAIFVSTPGNQTTKYELSITPAGWTFTIWTVIYGWLLLAHLYSLILLCRRNSVGPAYLCPPILNIGFLLTYTLNLLFNVVWLFLWDRDLIIYSSGFLWGVCLTSWIATGIIHGTVGHHGAWMAAHAKVDLWFIRIFWHNGLAMYTTWTTITALLNLAMVLKYELNIDEQLIVYIVLGVISGLMLLWFILENTALDRWMRYTVTQYAVIVVAMVGIYYKGYTSANMETGYFMVTLLGVSVFCFVARLGLVILRACKSPLYNSNKVSEDPVMSFSA
ncbi:unnamed protein product [Meganyctiphanes norvegica]|uniref:Endonuclease/exonuclease/phosphatase domain-containing protein n=1 Tax=Meganyctiphanes norvegica TaxID=48144 RepID=A0AAV2Q1X3_MEGNR